MTALILAAAIVSANSLDSLDACLQRMQREISQMEEEEGALETILDAIHQHLETSREYYNQLALEEAAILRKLGELSGVFTREDSLRGKLVESLSSYIRYLYSHRNLGGLGSFFARGGFRRMMHRQAYVDYLASRAAHEVFLLSLSRDSLARYRDSLEVLLLDVRNLRKQMEDIREEIYLEEAKQTEMRNMVTGRIEAARESLRVMEERRRARSRFVTELIVRSSPASASGLLPQPGSDAYLERNRGSVRWPAEGRLVRNFGIEKQPEYGTEINVEGITVVTQPGREIRAVAPGVVLYATDYLSMGKMVVLDHQDGYYTFYGHLGRVYVSIGDRVDDGSHLGRVGTVQGGQPGYYFEIRKGSEPVNPGLYLE